MRLALGIEYDGSCFYGWQTQKQEPTVQAVLEQALSRVADHPVQVMCAGRTDTGVHAFCQVAHFDTSAERSERSWVLGANTNLSDAATVIWVRRTAPEFHARVSAISRTYRYVIINRWTRPAIQRQRACWIRQPLDAEAMHQAAQSLLGENDFSAFRAMGCQASHPNRYLESIRVWREAEHVLVEVTANAFLYHMVRNIVGTLIPVGAGERPHEWVARVLASRDRTQAGPTAGANGLYFVAPRYLDHWQLPTNATPEFPRGWNLS